ncbi:hypothetical protein J7J47_07300 [Halomonas sp. ISL-60]|nr:hypothetical protein [Halomonas sp. ISL-56]MBT2772040.1 hypothetical protein [Halomonas sp. ISL-60]MBT2800503.1 hypothetical protein [Halomonas sp. ISL-56]
MNLGCWTFAIFDALAIVEAAGLALDEVATLRIEGKRLSALISVFPLHA